MDLKGLSSAITQFSVKFCNELDKHKSVVSSPLSAEFLLSLITLGTTDPAHSELIAALNLHSDDSIRSSFSQVSTQLKSVKGVTLNVANKIFVKEGPYELVSQLEEDAKKVFDAAIEKLDFDDGAAAAGIINKWVESKTNNRIQDLLSKDSISSDSRLVLVNAIYFKGSWKTKFDPQFTRELPFHVDSKITIDLPMMFMEDKFRYGEIEQLDAQLLEMPYEGEQASMLIILPKQIEGLETVMQKLADGFDLMDAIEKSMYSTKVQVTIPKFKIETEIDLKSLLPKLGIKAIFDQGNSGLTKILNNGEQLYVSKAIQKAFIEVNEEGAEAAAATAFTMVAMCAMDMPPILKFEADHPFLTVILINRTPYFWATHFGDLK